MYFHRNRTLIRGVILAFSVLIVGIGIFVLFYPTVPSREFDPVVYSSRNGLCSVTPSGDSVPYCPNIYLEHPKFSPDGQFIAAVRNPGSHTEIVVASRQGAVIRSLANSRDFIRPVWAPNGRHIFAISYNMPGTIGRWDWPSGQREIVPIESSDSNCRSGNNSTSTPTGRLALIQSISVAPSGQKAALLCDFQRIYIAELEPSRVRVTRMLAPSFSYVSIPEWLDDERFLVVARTTRGVPAGLWQIDANAGSVESIPVSGLSLSDYVVLSPDRRSVVVTGMPAGGSSWSLWRVDLADGKPVRLTHGEEDVRATWVR